MGKIYFITRLMNYVATGVLALMMLLTVSDVLMRYFFRRPLSGTTELTEVMMVVVVFLALAWSAVTRGHLKVDLVVSRFSPRVQAVVDSVTLLVGLGMLVIITWRSFIESMSVQATSSLLKFPMYPFHWLLTLGFAMLSLVVVSLIVQNIAEVVKK